MEVTDGSVEIYIFGPQHPARGEARFLAPMYCRCRFHDAGLFVASTNGAPPPANSFQCTCSATRCWKTSAKDTRASAPRDRTAPIATSAGPHIYALKARLATSTLCRFLRYPRQFEDLVYKILRIWHPTVPKGKMTEALLSWQSNQHSANKM